MKTSRCASVIVAILGLLFALAYQKTRAAEPTPSPATQSADNAALPADRERFHIFLLMGQSNMSGYAPLEPGDEQPAGGVFYLPTISTNSLAWQPARHPLHNRLRTDRFGPGLPFALDYQKQHPGVTVGLISLAWGGAPISKLNKGSSVYADALRKVAIAREQGVLKGVLWHQGESDTTTPVLADAYAGKLDALVADLRRDLSAPNLPFVVGNLAEFYGTSSAHNTPDRVARINQIRGILRGLPQRLANTAFVETTGLKSIDAHQVHFDRLSYIELGRRYAAALRSLNELQKADPSGNPK